VFSCLLLCSSLFGADNLLEITPQIGGSWHVNNPRYQHDIDLSYGVKFATRVSPSQLLEIGYDNIKKAKRSIPNNKTSINRYYLNLVKEFQTSKNISPYLLGGLGTENVSNQIQSLNSAPFAQYGAGIRWEIAKFFHLKTELRHLISFDGRSDVVGMVGFSIPFGSYREPLQTTIDPQPQEIEEVSVVEELVVTPPEVIETVEVIEEKTPEIVHRRTFSVQFRFDSSEISPIYDSEIEDFAEYMKQNPNQNAIINGYTDSTGDKIYNQKLSERRANAVKDKIIDKGISSNRIKAQGHGEENPIATNETLEGRKLNRRVEAEVYNPQ
ncbi:MAG: OmpA family protein, partial [Helicobacter sp.]|nr:OmpA family protein [Helicobacter sp.]